MKQINEYIYIVKLALKSFLNVQDYLIKMIVIKLINPYLKLCLN
jgi:hypothetical protein